MFPDDESVARAADEQETPDAVEVAQGPVKESTQTPYEHVSLTEHMDEPHQAYQLHAWIAWDGTIYLRSYEWLDVKQIQMIPAAMEKLVDAWLARHPRELTAEQVMTYLESHPYGIMTALDLKFDGVPAGLNDQFDVEANARRVEFHRERVQRGDFADPPPTLNMAH